MDHPVVLEFMGPQNALTPMLDHKQSALISSFVKLTKSQPADGVCIIM